MNKKIYDIVKSVLSEGSGGMCSECGSPSMNEGMCSECGYMKESKEMCSECGKGNMVEGECSECGYSEGEFKESKKLSKGQQYIAKQAKPYNKIGANDFSKLRSKKTETKEGKKFPDLSGDGKVTRKDILLGRGVKLKENITYKITLDESTNETFYFKENEVINIIENIVLEEKKKKNKKTKVNNVTKSAQSRSKKENDDYINSVVKKMKDYLKGGSKGEFEMNPKHFPKGNGELAKMDKMGYNLSDTAHEYIDNFTGAGLENLDYDEIHPNEKWVEKNIMGSSETGNNPEWANAVETPINKNRNQIRQDNLLAKIKRIAYQKDDQPVKMDRTGSDTGDDNNKLTSMLKTSAKKSKKLKESKIENTEVLNEITQMKNLINYNKNTQ